VLLIVEGFCWEGGGKGLWSGGWGARWGVGGVEKGGRVSD